MTIHILNMGVIDNSPMGRLMVTMLLAFAEFERALIIERTQTGKAAARSRTGFRDGRPPKFTPEQIDHAIGLLETHSYKQVTKMTGISRSTLQRENRKGENNNEKDYCIRHQIFPAHCPLVSAQKSKQDSTQVSCFDGFAHVETVDGMRTAHVRVICDPMESQIKSAPYIWHAHTMWASYLRRMCRWRPTSACCRRCSNTSAPNCIGENPKGGRNGGKSSRWGPQPPLTARGSCRQRGVQRGHAPLAR